MRTNLKPPDFDTSNLIEKTCANELCRPRIFYTNNPNAKFCCDSCKAKAFQLINKVEIEATRKFNRDFKLNCTAIAYLHSKGYNYPTERDLEIVGFVYSAVKGEVKSDVGTIFVFGDFELILKDNQTMEIRKTIDATTTTKKTTKKP